jgi:hypothetical protein
MNIYTNTATTTFNIDHGIHNVYDWWVGKAKQSLFCKGYPYKRLTQNKSG